MKNPHISPNNAYTKQQSLVALLNGPCPKFSTASLSSLESIPVWLHYEKCQQNSAISQRNTKLVDSLHVLTKAHFPTFSLIISCISTRLFAIKNAFIPLFQIYCKHVCKQHYSTHLKEFPCVFNGPCPLLSTGSNCFQRTPLLKTCLTLDGQCIAILTLGGVFIFFPTLKNVILFHVFYVG